MTFSVTSSGRPAAGSSSSRNVGLQQEAADDVEELLLPGGHREARRVVEAEVVQVVADLLLVPLEHGPLAEDPLRLLVPRLGHGEQERVPDRQLVEVHDDLVALDDAVPAIRSADRLESTTASPPSAGRSEIRPRSSGIECMIIRISVVLPAPLGPMRPSIGCSPRTSVVDVHDDVARVALDGFLDPDPRPGDGRGRRRRQRPWSFSISLSRRMSPSRPNGRNSRTRIRVSPNSTSRNTGTACEYHSAGQGQVRPHDDVEQAHGQDDAHDPAPDAGRPAQHQPDDRGQGDPDADVTGVEVPQHDGVHRPDQAHPRRRDREQPELGAERRLPEAAGERLVAADRDQEAPVRRAVDPPGVEEDRGDDGGRDQEPERTRPPSPCRRRTGSEARPGRTPRR